ncbi:MAG: hypothetical protein CMJ64_08545 [Planctomycetaceae bacterium]|nr:hypothetical protein [Planctomycetaceae bacterium]
MSSKWISLAIALVVILATVSNGSASAADQEFDAAAIEFFERDVRPVLAKRCYECHSAEAKELKGELRLDSRKLLLEGGDTGAAIVPGKPDESLLVDAINYGEVYQMPPKSKMPAAEVATLTKWVAMGAPWPKEQAADVGQKEAFDLQARKASHWCWQPVVSSPFPVVKAADWPRKDLDRFILAKLEQAGLSPADSADKRTLIRRAYFDLIGLPPSIENVNAFATDESPEAFEKVVDHLLESPHFGERWARHWMDLMRYAETYGHEFDYPLPHAFKYRDYLIRAFNADVPYDQFVMEHVAGDLLDDPRRHPNEGFNESAIATGFWWLGEATHSPVDVRDNEAGRIDNQLDVFGKTFLGLAIGCARCHNHKFDAISTKDYYALCGFLQSSRRAELFLDRHGKIRDAAEQRRALKQQADTLLAQTVAESPLSGEAFSKYLLAAREVMFGASKLDASAVAVEFKLDAPRLAVWVKALQAEGVKQSSHPMHVWHSAAEGAQPESFTQARKRLADEQQRQAVLDEKYPLFADFTDMSSWFVSGEAFAGESTTPGEWNGQAGGAQWLRPRVADSGRLGTRFQGALRSPTFRLDHRNIYYRAKGRGVKIRLILDGYFMDVYNALLFRGFSFDLNADDNFAWHRQAGDISRYVGHRAYIEILDHGDGYAAIDEIRFSNEDRPPEEFNELAPQLLSGDVSELPDLAKRYGDQWGSVKEGVGVGSLEVAQAELLAWAGRNELLAIPDSTAQELEALRTGWQKVEVPDADRTLGMVDGTAENERVFVRGNHKRLGDEAPRRPLEALANGKFEVAAGSGRLELARNLVEPSGPLTSRVLVNRLWHHLMGRGIVASTDNFGVLGQKPTHPQLLDHLAAQFVSEGWSVKRMLKTIMLSSTYRMSSTPNPQAAEVDPDNLLLHRARIRRLQGEAIRDAMLTISGRLDRTLYGGSVPTHITPFMQGRGRPKGGGPLDGNGRRSLYIEVRRNFLSPMMLAFDTPIPFNAVGRRNVSNVPAQALIVMNDPLVVEQAKLWAKRVIAAAPDPQQRIKNMYQVAFARLPTENELTDALAFIEQQATELGLTFDQPGNDEHVWTDLCHVLMNVKEFVFLR